MEAILLGGVFEALLLLASDAIDSFAYSSPQIDVHDQIKSYNKNKGRTLASDLCTEWLNGYPSIKTQQCVATKNACDCIYGEFDAGKGYDKTGKQKFPKLLSGPQREARRILLNNFENSDFLTFLEGIREKNKVEHVEKIMHADISAGNGTILLDQDKSAKGVEMPVNTAQKKSDSVIKLAKMKIRVTLDSNDVTNITLHSYQQRIEIRRRLLLYEERVNVERERHRQMVRDSTQKKIKMLVDRIELENSKGVAHPIKALHDENEFYENKKRLREIYELFMADRVKYKPCKYRTKLVKMVKICEPHSWTTKPAAKLWKRKTYKVYTREKTGTKQEANLFHHNTVANFATGQ